MAPSGIFNSHLIAAAAIERAGTEEQKRKYLPKMASGEMRGSLGLTEPNAGSDLQAIRTTAKLDGDHYVVNGGKTWITNSLHGHMTLLLVKTDPHSEPRHKGMSMLIAEKGPGYNVDGKLKKMGYRAIDTCQLSFDDFKVPKENLLGGVEGRGFIQTAGGLELGRINVAARGAGIAEGSLKMALRYAQERSAFGKPIWQHQAIQAKLADMVTQVEGAKALIEIAARKYDKGERCDLEAAMAKLAGSEAGVVLFAGSDAHLRRLQPVGRVRDRALLPRLDADGDRRGHERDPAPGDRQAADRNATRSDSWQPLDICRVVLRGEARTAEGREAGLCVALGRPRAGPRMRVMKLEGVKVLDLSMFLPGPHLTMMMADHGAEVIRIEPPSGEPTRELGASQNGMTVWFRNTHRNKQSVVLDLKKPEAVEAFMRLVDQADVVIEAFRPGVVDRLAVGAAAVRARNPRVVYCSISAFGQTGPLAKRVAHDLSIQAESGVVSLNRGNDGEPGILGLPAADMAGSLMALSGILMALLRREKTGQGDTLDISMQDGLVAWMINNVSPVFADGRELDTTTERSLGGMAFYNIYRCADGRSLSLGGSEIKFASNLLKALGRPDLIALAELPAGRGQDPLRAFLAETFASKPLAEWEAFLADVDLCWAPVKGVVEAMASEHLQAREMVLKFPDGQTHLGIPIKFADEPGAIRPVAPGAWRAHPQRSRGGGLRR